MNEQEIFRLIAAAMEQVPRAYAPYSRFHVGAAVLAEDGRIFTGCNVENASYPAGICAERTAVSHAVSEGVRRLRAVCICGGPNGRIRDLCPPCGICRQVLREFADPEKLLVILAKGPEEYRLYTLAELLPVSFGPEAL